MQGATCDRVFESTWRIDKESETMTPHCTRPGRWHDQEECSHCSARSFQADSVVLEHDHDIDLWGPRVEAGMAVNAQRRQCKFNPHDET